MDMFKLLSWLHIGLSAYGIKIDNQWARHVERLIIFQIFF